MFELIEINSNNVIVLSNPLLCIYHFYKFKYRDSNVEFMGIFFSVAENTDMDICDSGWTNMGNACYRAVLEQKSWFDALDACRNLRTDADLVSILDGNENLQTLAMSR